MLNNTAFRSAALAILSACLAAGCQPSVNKQTAQDEAVRAAAAAASSAKAAADAVAQQSHSYDTSAEFVIVKHPAPGSGLISNQPKTTAAPAAATKPIDPAEMKAIQNARALREGAGVPTPGVKP
jgi:hypothetical protein